MRSLLILALLARAASAAPTAPPAAPAPAAPAPPAPAGRCVIEPSAAPPAAPAAAAPPCHRPSAAVAAKIRMAVAKRYTPQYDRGKPEVAFGCDGLGAQIREIVIESGNGHGGTLALWRARRGAGTSYDVRGIVYAGRSMTRTASTPPFELAAGRVALPDLEVVRGALAATVREVKPPPRRDAEDGMQMTSSSHDFHVLVRLTDERGRVLERSFTGYEGSSDQDRYLGPELALESLGPITALAPAGSSITDEDRRLFAERFAAAVPHFDEPFRWWVMERHVDLARFLGTPTTIAGLLTRLAVTAPDRSKLDARANAVDALARITGWDARTGASVEEAAARYLAACKPR